MTATDPSPTRADAIMTDTSGPTLEGHPTGYGVSEPPIYRGLSTNFLDALAALAEAPHGGWWRDVLAHPDLILAVRREALDVYHRGASLFRVRYVRGRVVADTHAKYLVRQGQTRVALGEDGAFSIAGKALLWSDYAGPQTLAEMIKAAGNLVGVEKAGVHALVRASTNVIDLEIALAGDDPGEGDEPADAATGSGVAHRTGPRQDRLDAASLEERGNPGEAWLVFHEAKDFSNDALRAAPKRAPGIVAQMGRYRGSIGQNSGGLKYSYPFVCRALVRLDDLRQSVRAHDPAWLNRPQAPLDPLIREVADGTRRLQIECIPRLVVFGYDGAQKAVWEAEAQRLRTQFGLRVYAVGDPTAAKVAAAFRRPADVPLWRPPAPPVPPPATIPLPAGAPDGLSLHFVHGRAGGPVYLCNPGATTLTDVAVESVGVTSNYPGVVHTGTARHAVPEAPAGTGVHVDDCDVMSDGEVLTPYAITATRPDGTRLRATAIIDKGGPPGRFVALSVTDLPPAAAGDAHGGTAGAGAGETDTGADISPPPPATL
ncbi:hypothetical protein [Methylobacterium sp. sgz302541]|uniref:hypothetical protein n=1 Tax=unclassified Methylobacterium TaxID=2615210 RepID=UPI003D33CBA2